MMYVGLCGGGGGPVDGVHIQLSLVFDFMAKNLSSGLSRSQELKNPVSIPQSSPERADNCRVRVPDST